MARGPVPCFRPVDQGTVSIAATSATGSVALVQGASQYKITNVGAEAVFVRLGQSGVLATLPSGATGGSTPVASGATEIFSPPVTAPTHVAAITASGAATVYISAGEGL